MKLVRCRDHGFDCVFEVKGTKQEVLEKTAEHAQTVHGLEVTSELTQMVQEKMHDLPDEPEETAK